MMMMIGSKNEKLVVAKTMSKGCSERTCVKCAWNYCEEERKPESEDHERPRPTWKCGRGPKLGSACHQDDRASASVSSPLEDEVQGEKYKYQD